MTRRRALVAAMVMTGGLTVVLAEQPDATAAAPQLPARYHATLQGGIVVTGNAIGLSKENAANGPGIKDSIGTFMAAGSGAADTTPANPANPWPAGTTNDWHSNASAATLTLPAGSQVEYAELVWGGSYNYGGELSSSGDLDTSVTLSTAGQSTSIAPDPDTAVNIDTLGSSGGGTFPAHYYSRSADVTTWLAGHGSGTYTVGGIPATQATTIETLNAGGWSLAVVYSSDTAPMRWVGLDVGAAWVDENGQLDRDFAGFCAPTGGTQASVLAATLEGDASLNGDQLLAAPTGADPFVALSGPNNPESNFFASQLNGADGQLDTTGTFGSVNHDAASATNLSGARQGWDVTTVGADLDGGQSTLVLRAKTTGDSFVPVLAGLQADVAAAALEPTSALAPAAIASGAVSTLTVPIANTGDLPAEDTTFRLALPSGLGLTIVTVDGVPVAATAASLATGLDLGTVAAGATRTVQVQVSGQSAGGYALAPTVDYSFDGCAGLGPTTLSAPAGSQTLTVGAATVPTDRTAPDTRITKPPKKKGTKRKVRFSFDADEAGSVFACSVDHKEFRPCVSGKRFKVSLGKHTFEVRATDGAGNVDASPAAYRFKVVRKVTPAR